MFVVVKLPRKTHSKDVVKLRTGEKDLAVHADSLCGLKKVCRREGEVEWTQGGLVLRNSDSVSPHKDCKICNLQMSLNVFW